MKSFIEHIFETEQWIQKAIKRPGALRAKMGTEEGETIPAEKLSKLGTELEKKAEGEKTLSKGELTTLKQVNLAKTLKSFKK